MAENDPNQPQNDPTQAFQSRLSKMNGDAMAFATQLFDENFRLREDKRQLGVELEDAKRKVPKDGQVVLSAEKAAEYENYKTLGKFEDLKTRIEAHATLESKVAEHEKREVLREVGEIYGYKASILEDRDKAAGGLEFVIKQDPQNSKKKLAFIKEGDKETPVNEYAEANWADYMPSLKVEQGATPLQPTRTGQDPRPVSPNGANAAYQASKKTMIGSGKYSGL